MALAAKSGHNHGIVSLDDPSSLYIPQLETSQFMLYLAQATIDLEAALVGYISGCRGQG